MLRKKSRHLYNIAGLLAFTGEVESPTGAPFWDVYRIPRYTYKATQKKCRNLQLGHTPVRPLKAKNQRQDSVSFFRTYSDLRSWFSFQKTFSQVTLRDAPHSFLRPDSQSDAATPARVFLCEPRHDRDLGECIYTRGDVTLRKT